MNPLVTSLPLLVLFSEIADACIGGGCFAARARAARTYKDDAGVVHTVTTQEPDEHFSMCCSLLDVPESCRHMCTFEGYNTSAIQSSLTFSFPCPATALSQIQFCAARGEDHSQCCQAAGISSQCLVFCDQVSGNLLCRGVLRCYRFLS
ncbi:DB module [Cooperia oncophora]